MEMDGQWPLSINVFQNIRNGQFFPFHLKMTQKWVKNTIFFTPHGKNGENGQWFH
jgi:hypothetical protein